MLSLEEELRQVINRRSRENLSNTPDFILAEYLIDCLMAFESATRLREKYFGRPVPGRPIRTPTDPQAEKECEG